MGRIGAESLEIRLLGPVRVMRGGDDVALPKSRKVRALLALLALERGPVTRSRLCDLLFDVPNDPRGELRWCLSKLRGVVDHGGRRRIVADRSVLSLDLSDCRVDAVELAKLDVAGATSEELASAADGIDGDLLDGMQVDGAELTGWLLAQRQRYRSLHVAVLRELATRASPESDERLRRVDGWLSRTPLDLQAHELRMDVLLRAGRIRDAEDHLGAAMKALELSGVDWAPLRQAFLARRKEATSTQAIAASPAPPIQEEPRAPRRGSVVVMPFAEATPNVGQLANGLTDDVITRLAKLRVLFVIARGTSYALRERGVDAREAARVLNVEYVVSGVVRRHDERVTVHVELAEARDGGIVWADEMTGAADQTFAVLDSIVDRVVSGVAEEIERAETKRAILKTPSSLDAWEAYHRGLWHMYRFTGPENELAARFFEDALKLDPAFSRAHAGLSFTHFQNVFLALTPDRDRQMALALDTARSSLAADDRDPAAHWALGRALWLRGEQGESVAELERSIELSPNFALGHYTLGFVQAQSGDPEAAVRAAQYSRQLSPFDPLQFGMLGSIAIASMRLGDREAAAEWGVKAASRPNAHAHILAIAATSLALAKRREQAKEVVARIREKLPGYTVEDFLRAFRFTKDAEKLIRSGAKGIGFD